MNTGQTEYSTKHCGHNHGQPESRMPLSAN